MTQEIIDKKLEIEKTVIHTGTELQALKVKLSCHADYWWICVTPLKVNDTDYNWERIKNHISGVWNSSSISLDLRKLHGQIRTLEHSHLDFNAAGATNDFFCTFSNLITEKNILSAIFSYVAIAVLILFLIIILPYIVKTLQQSTQKLATEIHLAVLKNKKEGDARSQHMRSQP